MLNYLLKSPDSTTSNRVCPIVLDPNWEKLALGEHATSDRSSVEVGATWRPGAHRPARGAAEHAPGSRPLAGEHVPVSRNMVRFLLPKDGLPNIYDDRDLIITARCAMLAKEWGESESQYETLYKRRFYPELVSKLKERFDRYAILHVWDFQNPAQCTFHIENHRASGGSIPAAGQKHIRENFFAPELRRSSLTLPGGETRCDRPWRSGEPLPGKEAIIYAGSRLA